MQYSERTHKRPFVADDNQHNEGLSLRPPTLQLQASDPVQRDEPVDMPPLTITGPRPGDTVEGLSSLDHLRGTGTAGDVSMSHGDEDIARNSPTPGDMLPFTDSGWDANTILNRLGQYDTLAGTDSDAVRCVQAVAMASYIPLGPRAVADYLSNMRFEGLLRGGDPARQAAAFRVIDFVKARLQSRRATYGDLSWAQEAVHDLFYDDVSGTDAEAITGQIDPMLALNREVEPMDVWCSNGSELMSHITTLAPGEQLIITSWKVFFNEAFVDLEMQNEEGHAGIDIRDDMRVRIGRRTVRIRRIDASSRPSHTAIDPNRDKKSGHQLLVMKENVAENPATCLYEPEITNSGSHLQTITGAGDLAEMFTELPDIETYEYVQILGKVRDQSPVVSPWATP